ncbi:MAG: SpaH/EbpB family LPXTG-anchored major pilin [Coriobacteriales bacterium]|jgi:fimbrial isopeptide formation D2 family protein/LPXTG-motif cell wall-anchored protein|nr:SpaH/EbpB family LPXTG-anchored major pilin [Coriobacteriales bacterium]
MMKSKSFVQRAAALLMAVALAMMGTGLGSAAYGDPFPEKPYSLTIHKYVMPDTTAANPANDGTDQNVSIPADATPLDGITFNLYKVTIPDSGLVPVDGDYLLNSYTDPATLTSGSEVFALTEAKTASVTTNESGLAKASNLDPGYYLVVEQPDTRVTAPAAPFVVAVPMTNSTGDGWISDVHVYPKNEAANITKTADKTVIGLGETVNWTVRTSVPDDIAAFAKFNFIDRLDSALDYLPDSLELRGFTSSADKTGTVITADNYTVTEPSKESGVGNNNTLTVAFNTSGQPLTVPAGLADYKFIELRFATTVNDDILQRTNHELDNTASVKFTNRFNEEKTIQDTSEKIHTGSIIINKVDTNTRQGVNVNGAKFKIASSPSNANEGHYIQLIDGQLVDYQQNGYEEDNHDLDWAVTTSGGSESQAATAVFAGLPDYTEVSAGGTKTYLSYYLVEVQAPTGYNLLTEPVQVNFTAENSTVTTSYTIDTTVKNSTGFTLPKTGGMGTVAFTAGGLVLIGLALALLIRSLRRRRSN